MSTIIRRSMKAGLGAVALASLLFACGGAVTFDPAEGDTSDPLENDAGPTCPPHHAAGNRAEDCARYCDVYRCLGCPDTASACESVCTASPFGDACKDALLACAVEHVHEPRIVAELDCADDFTHELTITYPLDECGTCP